MTILEATLFFIVIALLALAAVIGHARSVGTPYIKECWGGGHDYYEVWVRGGCWDDTLVNRYAMKENAIKLSQKITAERTIKHRTRSTHAPFAFEQQEGRKTGEGK